MWNLSDKVAAHFVDPKNVGVLPDANAVGEFGELSGGDVFRLMLKVDPQTDIITAARFQAFGCGCAIAACSAVTEMVTGETVGQALRITESEISDFLGGLPAEKMYCAVLGGEVLRRALAQYRGEAPSPGDPPQNGALLCKCFGVDAGMIERAVRANRLTLPNQVTSHTKAGGACPNCFAEIEELLSRVNADMVEDGLIAPSQAYRLGTQEPRGPKPRQPQPPRPQPNADAMLKPAGIPIAGAGAGAGPDRSGRAAKPASPEKINLIRHAIDELRPHLQRDGGDCELVDVDGNTVFVKLSGNCVGCQLASVTIAGVQDRLIEKLAMPLRIMPVQ
jgi:NifU-like protein